MFSTLEIQNNSIFEIQNYFTIKIQNGSTLEIQEDLKQKYFLTHFMLLTFLTPENMIPHLRFKKPGLFES